LPNAPRPEAPFLGKVFKDKKGDIIITVTSAIESQQE
jgi:hypothetical protein